VTDAQDIDLAQQTDCLPLPPTPLASVGMPTDSVRALAGAVRPVVALAAVSPGAEPRVATVTGSGYREWLPGVATGSGRRRCPRRRPSPARRSSRAAARPTCGGRRPLAHYCRWHVEHPLVVLQAPQPPERARARKPAADRGRGPRGGDAGGTAGEGVRSGAGGTPR